MCFSVVLVVLMVFVWWFVRVLLIFVRFGVFFCMSIRYCLIVFGWVSVFCRVCVVVEFSVKMMMLDVVWLRWWIGYICWLMWLCMVWRSGGLVLWCLWEWCIGIFGGLFIVIMCLLWYKSSMGFMLGVNFVVWE